MSIKDRYVQKILHRLPIEVLDAINKVRGKQSASEWIVRAAVKGLGREYRHLDALIPHVGPPRKKKPAKD